MKKISIKFKGVTPILFNRFRDESLEDGNGLRPKNDKELSRREQAENTLHKDENGIIFIPQNMLFSCLIESGKFEKMGKSKITTMKTSLIPAGVSIQEEKLLLNTKEFEVDSRSVVNPSTQGRIMKHRARIDDWEFECTLVYDPTLFSSKILRVLIDHAGQKLGLGDYRPQRKGIFGKFNVISWEEHKS